MTVASHGGSEASSKEPESTVEEYRNYYCKVLAGTSTANTQRRKDSVSLFVYYSDKSGVVAPLPFHHLLRK